jgi:hypothetical protein
MQKSPAKVTQYSVYKNLIWFVKKTFFEKSKPGLDSAYIILKFRFWKSYDISSIPIVIVKFNDLKKNNLLSLKTVSEAGTAVYMNE